MKHAVYGDSNNRQQVIDYFKMTKGTNFTEESELEFLVASPISSRHYFESDIQFNKAAVKHLAGEKDITIKEEERDDNLYLVCSGPGAIAAARAIRDEAGMKFTGSDNIPDGRAIDNIALSDVESVLGTVVGKDSPITRQILELLRKQQPHER
jgi:hypothetical protein